MSLRLSKHGQTSDIFGTQANSTSEAGKTRMRDTRNQPKVGDECLWGFGNSKFNSFEASLVGEADSEREDRYLSLQDPQKSRKSSTCCYLDENLVAKWSTTVSWRVVNSTIPSLAEPLNTVNSTLISL
ncbi:hypothetical protein B0H11DRAFT_1927648 [Mycena galericulata]|nr:hypothetical protein B0H11DRAFT_1927648 [Mycena galericulata]